MNKKIAIFAAALVWCGGAWSQSSDNGDGTFTNPVIWGDFPDPDVIMVDDTYYFVSTSMHYFPGVTILQSKDLVNWEIAANVVDEFKEHPGYDLAQGQNRYAQGQWATSLRHLNGKFLVLFNTNSEGTYLYSSPTIDGPWSQTKIEGHQLYDPGMLVDDDGRLYVVHGNTDIFVTELDTVTYQEKGPAQQIYRAHRGGLEGNRAYRIGDYYYIYCTYGGDQSGQTCLRSRSLYGPYEEREVMFEAGNRAERNLHQACMIPVGDKWWSVIFQDRDGLGRIPWLIPIYWVNDWPIMGNPTDGILTMSKPITGAPEPLGEAYRTLAGSDDFSGPELALKWQFNHNPDKSKYSLTERPGYLRLRAATVTDSLVKARNTITQRIFGPYSQATAKIDFSHLRRGDRAGLVILAKPFATLTYQDGRLAMTVDEAEKASVPVKSKVFWLRAQVDGLTDMVRLYYSENGIDFQELGCPFHMEFTNKYFCGNRYGLFCYATQSLGGYIDVDGIEVEQTPLFSRAVNRGDVLQAEWADYWCNTEPRLLEATAEELRQTVAFVRDGGMIGFHDLEFPLNINSLTFRVRNHDAHNVMLEAKDNATGHVLGKVALPESADDYIDVNMPLIEALPSGTRLEFRVWNRDWNQPSMGRVDIDAITFND
ncbi:MAG: glycoside hydrolase 43 family protein [Bacteroidales bacterium]|nr:glycoside hydrolase 43 family protein [Bacteroidales bacterium]